MEQTVHDGCPRTVKARFQILHGLIDDKPDKSVEEAWRNFKIDGKIIVLVTFGMFGDDYFQNQ